MLMFQMELLLVPFFLFLSALLSKLSLASMASIKGFKSPSLNRILEQNVSLVQLCLVLKIINVKMTVSPVLYQFLDKGITRKKSCFV